MLKRAFLFFILILAGLASSCISPSHKTVIEDFSLWDHRGVAHHLYEQSDAKAVVLISCGAGCPIVRRSMETINALEKKYEKKGVVFWMIDPNQLDDREALQKEAEAFGVDMPILMDEAQIISRSLGISRTAEAIVIDTKNWTVAYRGAIDDQLNYETQRSRAEKSYLASALDSVLRGWRVKTPETPVKGCLITYAPVAKDINYIQHVAPILKNRCLSCHYTGGPAPWAMKDYSSVKHWTAMTREVIRTRRMPPRSIDSAYPKMRDAYFLTPSETKTIVDWIESGSTRGEGEDPLPAENKKLAETEWPWGEPDMILTAPNNTRIPATGWLDWQKDYIADEKAIPQDVWVRAVYYKPGNMAAVHHGSVYSKIDCQNKTRGECLDNDLQRDLVRYALPESERYQDNPWANHSTPDQTSQNKNVTKDRNTVLPANPEAPGGSFQFLGGYNVGFQVQPFPKGAGKFISKGSVIRFIKHYKTTGKPETDLSKVGLYLYRNPKQPIKPLHHTFIQSNDFVIPPRAKGVKYGGQYRVKEDIILYGAAPHLHYRGRSMKLTAQYPDGKEQILWSDPDFNYTFGEWEYRFETPLTIPKGTLLKFEGVFDNSPQNPKNPDPNIEVRYGFQLYQEMFWVMIVYTTV